MSKKRAVLDFGIEINEQPSESTKFLNPLVSGEIFNSRAIRELYKIEFSLLIENCEISKTSMGMFIKISLVRDEDTDKLHEYDLFCANQHVRATSTILLNESQNQIYLFKIDDSNKNEYKIDELYIVIKPHHQLLQQLERETLKNYSYDDLINLEEIPIDKNYNEYLNKCKLKLELVMCNPLTKKADISLCKPVFSRTIHNRFQMENHIRTDREIADFKNLKIIDSSAFEGSYLGRDEIILITSFIDPYDIEVEFYKPNENDYSEFEWTAFGDIDRSKIYSNQVLVVKIPKLIDRLVSDSKNSKLKVYYRLFKPSTMEYSEPLVFFYKNLNTMDDENFSEHERPKRKCDSPDSSEISFKKTKIEENQNTEEKDMKKRENIGALQLDSFIERATIEELKIELRKNFLKMNNFFKKVGDQLLKFTNTRDFKELFMTFPSVFKTQDENGNTPLHLAILNKFIDIFQIYTDLISTFPALNIVNIKNNKGLTPLLVACYSNEAEMVEYLLESNADITETDLDGNTVLHIACKNRNQQMIDFIMPYIEKFKAFETLNQKNHEGVTALHIAVQKDCLGIFEKLLEQKQIKVDIRDRQTGRTVLHYAASKSGFKQYLIRLLNKSNANVNIKSYDGCTPILTAAANKNYLGVHLLKCHGANLNDHSDIPIPLEDDYVMKKSIEKFVEAKNSNPKMEITEIQSKDQNQNKPVKISEQIMEIYDAENEIQETMKDLNRKIGHLLLRDQTCSLAYYCQYDDWLVEILKSGKALKRELFQKIMCYDIFKKCFYENQFKSAQMKNVDTIKLSVYHTKKITTKMKSSQIKLSVQETFPNELTILNDFQ